jgi:hypothetical protein
MKSFATAVDARFRAGRIVVQTCHYIRNDGRQAVLRGDLGKVNKWMGTIRIISGLRASDRERALREVLLQVRRVQQGVSEGAIYVPINSKAPFYAHG